MKKIIALLTLAAAGFTTSFAADKAGSLSPAEAAAVKAGKLVPISQEDAGWANKAQKNYPLQVCVVSDEKLGSMGDSAAYVFRAEGQPDRLVLFCCAGCEEDFKADPVKHVAKLDAAAGKKGEKSRKPSAK